MRPRTVFDKVVGDFDAFGVAIVVESHTHQHFHRRIDVKLVATGHIIRHLIVNVRDNGVFLVGKLCTHLWCVLREVQVLEDVDHTIPFLFRISSLIIFIFFLRIMDFS